METIKLFTFITISLIPTIVSSTKCKNQDMICTELCCKKTQYYEHVSEKCKALPESGRIWWETSLHDNIEIVEVAEFGGCELSHYLAGTPYCFSPYYDVELKKFNKNLFFNVPCDRLQEIPIAKIIAVVYIGICLPISVIYTCIKGLKKTFIFKLYSWYLVSMAVFLMAGTVKVQWKLNLGYVAMFFFVSSWLWLNVIGFQMWSGYKEANAQDNSHNNQRRLICYSIFVWGISAILTGIHYCYGRGNSWFSTTKGLIEIAIIFFSLVSFLALSVNICIIRCKVVNLTTETHFKLRLASLFLRLGLMMGFPRILFYIFYVHSNLGEVVWAVFFTLEPYVLFIVLLWKPNNCFNCNLICCCCRKSGEITKPTEIVDIRIN